MKKSMSIILPLLLTGLLTTHACFSDDIGHTSDYVTGQKCVAVATHLHQLAQTKPDDQCAKAVSLSAKNMELTANLVFMGRHQQALGHLVPAERGLQTIQRSTVDCAYFSPRVTPIIAEVLIIMQWLETQR